LGARDLDALLGGGDSGPTRADGDVDGEGELRQLPVQQIQPGKYQPRRRFDDEALEELAASIRAQGLIQPVIVRPLGQDRYELIAGERRWRAAQRAKLDVIPALVKEVSEQAAPAMALIENIQRQDLSSLEEAQALKRLIEDFQLTHQQVADAIGRSRVAVSNLLRLLDLPAAIGKLLDEGRLQMGHARALLTLEEGLALRMAREAATNEWSVRQLEAAVRSAQKPAATGKPHGGKRDADIAALERDLSERLATQVGIEAGRGGRGKLVIHYHSADQLEGVLERLRGAAD
ncbi:MAG TPA: ParB/RepB/Spo0J family partition protein, partial [Rhodanobacteraceae bacterium]|nr:ParB/RepB/Spo0J family partition protein [Rhodanobacteraceae bacterium]